MLKDPSNNELPETQPSNMSPKHPNAANVSLCNWVAGFPADQYLSTKLQDKHSPVYSLAALGKLGGRHVSTDVKPGESVKVRS